MTFWVVAVALMVAVVALLAVPLSKRRSAEPGGVDHDRSNIALFQDQMTELERDRGQGIISAQQFEQARVELSQRLLDDVTPPAAHAGSETATSGGAWRYAILACVPIATVLAYLALGVPQALDPNFVRPPQGASVDAAGLEQLAQRLAERLEQNPNDTEAWVLLARSYQMLGKAPEAVKAFARAVELIPDSPQLHADYADVQVAANDGQWTPQARASVGKALAIDAAHPKALWLAGSEAFVRKDYAGALAFWEKLLPLAEAGSEVAQVIEKNIAEARALAAGTRPPAAAAQAQPASPSARAPAVGNAADAHALKGTVTLDAKLTAEVSPADAVFVFARATQGPKLPLAIRRISVQELPYAFSLDDAAAMAPGMTISKFGQVIVGARISRSGDATRKPGDLEGFSAPVKPGATGIEVRINARVQ